MENYFLDCTCRVRSGRIFHVETRYAPNMAEILVDAQRYPFPRIPWPVQVFEHFLVIILQEVYHEAEGYVDGERIKAFVQERAAAVDEYAAVFGNEHLKQGVAGVYLCQIVHEGIVVSIFSVHISEMESGNDKHGVIGDDGAQETVISYRNCGHKNHLLCGIIGLLAFKGAGHILFFQILLEQWSLIILSDFFCHNISPYLINRVSLSV